MASSARTGLLRQLPRFGARPFLQTALKPNRVAQIAPFSTTLRKSLLPQGPQIIEGTVNDPAPTLKPHPTHGSYHWTSERFLSVILVPLTIAPFAAQTMNPTLDALLVGTLIVHTHMGFQSVIIDYLPTWSYGTARKVFDWGLNLATLLVAIGFYEFETNDVGLCEAIKRVWHAGSAKDATIGKADISSLGHDGKLKNLTS